MMKEEEYTYHLSMLNKRLKDAHAEVQRIQLVYQQALREITTLENQIREARQAKINEDIEKGQQHDNFEPTAPGSC